VILIVSFNLEQLVRFWYDFWVFGEGLMRESRGNFCWLEGRKLA